MSGHSKWSTIKRKKGLNDSKKSSIFSKMSRLITIAVHEGGGIGDVEKNVSLRLVVERAKAANMPKDTIQRAIDKASGGEGKLLKEVMYEGFGPEGCALLISATTDNTNRTYADVKSILDKNGGKIGSIGSVSYMFTKCGLVEFKKTDISEDDLFKFTEDVSAIDVDDEGDMYTVFVPFEALGQVKKHTSEEPVTLDVFFKPETLSQLSAEGNEKLEELIDKLEDHDDVQTVYTNSA